jgi:pyruvate dehydrogenase E1 component
MPAIPEAGSEARAAVEAGVLAGMYCFDRQEGATVNLFGSGAIMSEVIAARAYLEKLGIASNLWSVTSYNELMREGMAAERARLMSVGEAARKPLVAELLENEEGVFVAASDYMKALPLSIARWVPGPYEVLGTDGFGLSEDRHVLRDYFEVSAEWVAYTALSTLAQNNLANAETARQFAEEHELDVGKMDPFDG